MLRWLIIAIIAVVLWAAYFELHRTGYADGLLDLIIYAGRSYEAELSSRG